MKGDKEYRFKDNPEEKLFHDKFIEKFGQDYMGTRALSMVVTGIDERYPYYPEKHLSVEEENMCLNLIQWLGSPVGNGFLRDCGYVKEERNTGEDKVTNDFQERLDKINKISW